MEIQNALAGSPAFRGCLLMLDYEDLLGTPFVNRGRDPKKALDCYGLAKEVFRRYNIDLPEYWISCDDASRINQTVNKEKESGRWIRLEKPQEPSLIVLRFNKHEWNHVGVYIGNGRFIHTAKRTGVRVERLDHPYWRHKIEGYYIPAR